MHYPGLLFRNKIFILSQWGCDWQRDFSSSAFSSFQGCFSSRGPGLFPRARCTARLANMHVLRPIPPSPILDGLIFSSLCRVSWGFHSAFFTASVSVQPCFLPSPPHNLILKPLMLIAFSGSASWGTKPTRDCLPQDNSWPCDPVFSGLLHCSISWVVRVRPVTPVGIC